MAKKKARPAKKASPAAAARPVGRPRKPPEPLEPPAPPLLAPGQVLPDDPVDASLALMRAQLARATKTSEAANIGRAIAALSAEARKREDSLTKRMGRLTLPERVRFTQSMVEEWPREQRLELRDWLNTLEPQEGSSP